MLTLIELVELAKEVEITDPIDWGMLNVTEDDAYTLIASGILDLYQSLETDEHRDQMLLSSLVKLTVENFVLNLKLLQSLNPS